MECSFEESIPCVPLSALGPGNHQKYWENVWILGGCQAVVANRERGRPTTQGGMIDERLVDHTNIAPSSLVLRFAMLLTFDELP